MSFNKTSEEFLNKNGYLSTKSLFTSYVFTRQMFGVCVCTWMYVCRVSVCAQRGDFFPPNEHKTQRTPALIKSWTSSWTQKFLFSKETTQLREKKRTNTGSCLKFSPTHDNNQGLRLPPPRQKAMSYTVLLWVPRGTGTHMNSHYTLGEHRK